MTMILFKNRYQARFIALFLQTRGINATADGCIVLAPISKGLAVHLIRFAVKVESFANSQF